MFYVCLLHDTAEYMAQPPDHLYCQVQVQVPGLLQVRSIQQV